QGTRGLDTLSEGRPQRHFQRRRVYLRQRELPQSHQETLDLGLERLRRGLVRKVDFALLDPGLLEAQFQLWLATLAVGRGFVLRRITPVVAGLGNDRHPIETPVALAADEHFRIAQ